MTAVIDIGCHDHPAHKGTRQDSIRKLIERFKPDRLYGFDPHPDTAERDWQTGGCLVTVRRLAAWTHAGDVPYTAKNDQPLGSYVGAGDRTVACFDIADALADIADEAHAPVILKLDAQGAEYELLDRLIATGGIRRVERVLVEWHDLPARAEDRDRLLNLIPCPVEEWSL